MAMPVVSLWALILMRLAALSGERVAFHGLGRHRQALVTTQVAYGGAALLLWLWSFFAGQGRWVSQAIWPGAIYAVSFTAYTQALALGPVSLVNGFANATVVMLFLLSPIWSPLPILALSLFTAGGVMLLPRGGHLSRGVWWMLASGAALVAGRILDAGHQALPSLPYAATLFTVVVMWLAVPVTAYGLWPAIGALIGERPGWAMAAATLNAVSYLTVLELLRQISPTLVEAVSAWAGVVATIAGVIGFKEGGATRKVSAATLMTVGTMILLFSRPGRMG